MPQASRLNAGFFLAVGLALLVALWMQRTRMGFESRAVGPFYGLFGLGMALYFASQGAGRLLWPLLANLTRLVIGAGGGWLALRWGGDLSSVFLALSAALAAFGLMNGGAVAGGAWSGPIGWPLMRAPRVARELVE